MKSTDSEMYSNKVENSSFKNNSKNVQYRPETLETLFLLIPDPVSITLQANRAEIEQWRGLTQL